MWPKWTRVCTKNESPSFWQQKGGIRKRELTVCKSDGCLALIQQPFYTWSCRTRRFLFHGLFMECWVKLKQVTSCPYRHLQSFHRSSHFLLGSDRLFPEDKEEAAVALQTLPRPPPQSVDTWRTHTVWCWVFCALTGSVWLTAQPVLDLLDAFCILSLPASKRKLAVFNKATLPLLSQQPHASRPPRLPEAPSEKKRAVLSDDKNAADTWMSPLKHPSLFGGNWHGLDGRRSLKGQTCLGMLDLVWCQRSTSLWK